MVHGGGLILVAIAIKVVLSEGFEGGEGGGEREARKLGVEALDFRELEGVEDERSAIVTADGEVEGALRGEGDGVEATEIGGLLINTRGAASRVEGPEFERILGFRRSGGEEGGTAIGVLEERKGGARGTGVSGEGPTAFGGDEVVADEIAVFRGNEEGGRVGIGEGEPLERFNVGIERDARYVIGRTNVENKRLLIKTTRS